MVSWMRIRGGIMNERLSMDLSEIRNILHINTTLDTMQSMLRYAYIVYINSSHQVNDDSMYFLTDNITMTVIRYIVDNDRPDSDFLVYMRRHKAKGLRYVLHAHERSDIYARYLDSIGITPYSPNEYESAQVFIMNHFNDAAILGGLDADNVTFNVRKALLANDATIFKNLMMVSLFSNAGSDINAKFIAAMGFNDDVTPCERGQWNIDYTAGITDNVRRWMTNSIRQSGMSDQVDNESLNLVSFIYVSMICMLRERHWGFSDENDMKTVSKMMETVNNDDGKTYELLRQVNDFIKRGVSPSDKVAMDSMKRQVSDKEHQS